MLNEKHNVSIVMCNYNGESYLKSAIETSLMQFGVDVELIIVDDFSTDDSRNIISSYALHDARVRPILLDQNHGPGYARNVGVEAAQFEWIAIHDSDDLFHPERLSRLVTHALNADLLCVADNQIIFFDDRNVRPSLFINARDPKESRFLNPAEFIDANHLYSTSPVLGYLKPVFRSSLIENGKVRYDEKIRIGEDYDFLLKLIIASKRMGVLMDPLYFYRKREKSISERLTPSHVMEMIDSDNRFRAESGRTVSDLLPSLNRRLANLTKTLAYENFVVEFKSYNRRKKLLRLLRHPNDIFHLLIPTKARLRKFLAKFASKPDGLSDLAAMRKNKNILFLSKQRITGPNDGSSVYDISILKYLHSLGYNIDFHCPSTSVFGSKPFLKLSEEIDFFGSYTINHSWRIGKYVFSRDPKIYFKGFFRLLSLKLNNLNITKTTLLGPAPYSIGSDLKIDDIMNVAAIEKLYDFIIFDYAYLVQYKPYLFGQRARNCVITHDIFSFRDVMFQSIGQKDSVSSLTVQQEAKLWNQADCIVAIQENEASIISTHTKESHVIVANMAHDFGPSNDFDLSDNADPSLLFVGSSTAPNVDAINWFLENVWPQVLAAVPNARLEIAGGVCSRIKSNASNVVMQGFVNNISSCYKNASVVISPLRAGSGLKIKLIEAMAYGKAIVASSVTCQGLETWVGQCVWIADEASEQAVAINSLLTDNDRRRELERAAYNEARQRFNADYCYGELGNYIYKAVSDINK